MFSLIVLIICFHVTLVISEIQSHPLSSSNAPTITTGPIHRSTITYNDSLVSISISTEKRSIITRKPIQLSSQYNQSHISVQSLKDNTHTSSSSPLAGFRTMITFSPDEHHSLSFLIISLHSSNTQIPLTRGCTSRRDDCLLFIAVFYLTTAENTSYTSCHTSGCSPPKRPSISSLPQTHPPILHLELCFTLLYTSVTESTVTLDNAPATDIYRNVFSMSVSCLTSGAY